MTIGNFDGVHVGHRRILQSARTLADAEGTAVVAMTMNPPPDLVLRPSDVPQRISPHDVKCRLLLEAGADWVVTARTDKALLTLSAEEFVDRVIVDRFAPRCVVEGHDFAFGRGRIGNVELLEAIGAERGFTVRVVEAVAAELADRMHRVSSTLIRRLLLAGRIEDANRCLAREFVLYGRVIPGQRRGRELEFPTANLDTAQQVVPGDGVYAGKSVVGERRFATAVSIGDKPTLGPAQERTVEAFLIGAEGDYYGQSVALSFVRRLRDQLRFDGTEQLRAQIAKDVQAVRAIVK